GPIFMFATLGVKLLQSTTAAIIILTTHYISAALNGLIYCRTNKSLKAKISENSRTQSSIDFGETVANAVSAVLSVGGLIAVFYMLSDMIKYALPTDMQNNTAVAFAMGLFEMTVGIFNVCKTADLACATVLCSAILSFGGLCVFMQCYAFLSRKGIKAVTVLKMKITQSAIATIISYFMTLLLL
ncbi:MAG: hypothetical protein NC099_05535, partial [Corallococcus sp.]|nr:hypothetical protein [Corallococcus sp.]